jgi:hypothetical protein
MALEVSLPVVAVLAITASLMTVENCPALLQPQWRGIARFR